MMDYVIKVTPPPCAVVVFGTFRGRVNACFTPLCTFYLDAKITDPYAFFDTSACDVRSLKILARSLNVAVAPIRFFFFFFLRVFAFAVFTAFLLGSQLGSAQVGTG